MRTQSPCLPLLFFFLLLFTQCADDLERLEIASNIQVNIEVRQVNDLQLKAEVKNLGSFEIVNQGFLFSYAPFECADVVELLSGQIDVNNGDDFEFSAAKANLNLEAEFFVRAFVDVIHPASRESRRICSGLPGDSFAAGAVSGLILTGGFEELADKSIRLSAKLNGLEDGASVQEHGFFWIISEEKQTNLTNPQTVFDSVLQNIRQLGPLDKITPFSLEENFRFGVYYYAMPYVVFDGNPIFDEGGYQEIFIGDYWAAIDNSGLSTSQHPQFLAEAATFTIDDIAYICTGFKVSRSRGNQFLTATCWRYDPVTNKYEAIPNYPGSAEGRRRNAVGFALHGKGYVGTGRNNLETTYDTTQFKEFYEYTPETDGWRRVQDFPVPVYGAVSFVIGDYAYVGTGRSCQDTDGNGRFSCSMIKDFYRFDPRSGELDSLGLPMGLWEPIPPMPTLSGRRHAVGFSINGIGYVATGVTPDGHSRGVYAYNPASKTWKRKTDFPGSPRQKAVSFTIANRAYLATGSNAGIKGELSTFKDLWEYVPTENVWLQKADISGFNFDSGAPFAIGGKGYVYGGYVVVFDESISYNLRVYTPEKETFESAQ